MNPFFPSRTNNTSNNVSNTFSNIGQNRSNVPNINSNPFIQKTSNTSVGVQPSVQPGQTQISNYFTSNTTSTTKSGFNNSSVTNVPSNTGISNFSQNRPVGFPYTSNLSNLPSNNSNSSNLIQSNPFTTKTNGGNGTGTVSNISHQPNPQFTSLNNNLTRPINSSLPGSSHQNTNSFTGYRSIPYNPSNNLNRNSNSDLDMNHPTSFIGSHSYSLDRIDRSLAMSDKEDLCNAILYDIPQFEEENIILKSHCISYLPEYFPFSQEELRYLNYRKRTNQNISNDPNSDYSKLTKESINNLSSRLQTDSSLNKSFKPNDILKLKYRSNENVIFNKVQTTTSSITPNRIGGGINFNNNFVNNFTSPSSSILNNGSHLQTNNASNNIGNNFLNGLNCLSGTNDKSNQSVLQNKTNNFNTTTIPTTSSNPFLKSSSIANVSTIPNFSNNSLQPNRTLNNLNNNNSNQNQSFLSSGFQPTTSYSNNFNTISQPTLNNSNLNNGFQSNQNQNFVSSLTQSNSNNQNVNVGFQSFQNQNLSNNILQSSTNPFNNYSNNQNFQGNILQNNQNNPPYQNQNYSSFGSIILPTDKQNFMNNYYGSTNYGAFNNQLYNYNNFVNNDYLIITDHNKPAPFNKIKQIEENFKSIENLNLFEEKIRMKKEEFPVSQNVNNNYDNNISYNRNKNKSDLHATNLKFAVPVKSTYNIPTNKSYSQTSDESLFTNHTRQPPLKKYNYNKENISYKSFTQINSDVNKITSQIAYNTDLTFSRINNQSVFINDVSQTNCFFGLTMTFKEPLNMISFLETTTRSLKVYELKEKMLNHLYQKGIKLKNKDLKSLIIFINGTKISNLDLCEINFSKYISLNNFNDTFDKGQIDLKVEFMFTDNTLTTECLKHLKSHEMSRSSINSSHSSSSKNYGPKLDRGNYTLSISLEDLQKKDRRFLKSVQNFKMQNEHGRLEFLEPVDLINTNLNVILLQKNNFEIEKHNFENFNKLKKKIKVTFYNYPNIFNNEAELKGYSLEILSEECKKMMVIKI